MIEPPLVISFSARWASAVSEKHETSMVCVKLASRRIDVAAVEFVLVREGDGVDEEIEPAPLGRELGEQRVDRRLVVHVARIDELGAEFGGQRLDPLLQGIALIGQRDFGALRGERLGDAPGDRPVVGHAEDEAALAAHQVSRRHGKARRIGRSSPRDPFSLSRFSGQSTTKGGRGPDGRAAGAVSWRLRPAATPRLARPISPTIKGSSGPWR